MTLTSDQILKVWSLIEFAESESMLHSDGCELAMELLKINPDLGKGSEISIDQLPDLLKKYQIREERYAREFAEMQAVAARNKARREG